ncbi:phage tail protein [Pseudoalteromonas sp. S16_S37]|uniref:phage tail protein n=1 Tax=Pseudoalteromonas sp. S16_S37 TaxID=2720228 RepID=UPI00168081D5|nr:tail fiber protein [Pseudoalteromonas sp. S16_S37]MBD1581573.1 microcystin-dependent protein [Pseudoalteromonas sp. S16_S37]
MSADSYIGTMRPFGGNFTIRSWTSCQGQLLAISENTALFSLISDFYGGDARTSFGIPDMRGRSPLGMGRMIGGAQYTIGQRAGSEYRTLDVSQMPQHNHNAAFTPSGGGVAGTLQVSKNAPNTTTPDEGAYLASNTTSQMYYKAGGFAPPADLTQISGLTIDGGSTSGSVTVGLTGSSEPFSIVNPFQVVNWQMVLEGVYPSRA